MGVGTLRRHHLRHKKIDEEEVKEIDDEEEDWMAVGTLRRYYRQKAEAAIANGEEALAMAFQAKLEETPGTALPDDFPHREKVLAAGYGFVEDLNGATEDELKAKQFGKNQIAEVLTAVKALVEAVNTEA